jgi:hypothetical protein
MVTKVLPPKSSFSKKICVPASIDIAFAAKADKRKATFCSQFMVFSDSVTLLTTQRFRVMFAIRFARTLIAANRRSTPSRLPPPLPVAADSTGKSG